MTGSVQILPLTSVVGDVRLYSVVLRRARGNRSRRTNPIDRKEQRMNWLVTLVIGGIVGWLGSLLMKTDAQMGLIANVIVGIIGSSLGFWLAGVLGLSASGPIMGWVIAVAGAALFIVILKMLNIVK
jgi:uncharacterized membrane protein YeaQ/YmgE (transglycosylase-associated protein family)